MAIVEAGALFLGLEPRPSGWSHAACALMDAARLLTPEEQDAIAWPLAQVKSLEDAACLLEAVLVDRAPWACPRGHDTRVLHVLDGDLVCCDKCNADTETRPPFIWDWEDA